MIYYFITGSSKGLGLELSKILLSQDYSRVIGLARNKTIEHEDYQHVTIDLSKHDDLMAFQFPQLNDATKIVLVNNAGIVGDINHVGNINNDAIADCFTINLIAPAVLMNKFALQYKDVEVERLIVNISSGAGKSAIDGWSSYCASKAGVDMFSKVFAEEAQLNGNGIKILSLAPGIVDTGMQEEIRQASKEGFSNIDRFIAYKKEGDLADAAATAQKVFQFIQNPEIAENTLCSVRDL